MNKHRVTREWINEHRTKRGAWTKAQIEALGLTWNKLEKGWPRKIEGLGITQEQKLAFERGKNIKAKKYKDLQKGTIKPDEFYDLLDSLKQVIHKLDYDQVSSIRQFVQSVETMKKRERN